MHFASESIFECLDTQLVGYVPTLKRQLRIQKFLLIPNGLDYCTIFGNSVEINHRRKMYLQQVSELDIFPTRSFSQECPVLLRLKNLDHETLLLCTL